MLPRPGPACVALLLPIAVAGCALERCGAARPGDHLTCPMPGWLDRAFDVDVPASWDGVSALPVIYALHGGGGNRAATSRLTCPGGDLASPDCLPAKATAAGYAVVRPDGTGTRPYRNTRTWNAGGGDDGWQCVSGAACKSGADDIAYFDALAVELDRILPADARRLYATGISNGGAMSHRLGCSWTDHPLAAIAPVGGANQYAAAGGDCPGGTPVLHIHGTDDPCWPYQTSDHACANIGDDGARKIGVDETMAGWRARNGCSDQSTEEALPDAAPDDGTSSVRVRWSGCAAAVELVRIEGGGHTWPGGYQYFPESLVGRTSRDFDADDLILEFFGVHVRP